MSWLDVKLGARMLVKYPGLTLVGGLAIAGYSGRDASIMAALTAALEAPEPFPRGLFWVQRGPGAPRRARAPRGAHPGS